MIIPSAKGRRQIDASVTLRDASGNYLTQVSWSYVGTVDGLALFAAYRSLPGINAYARAPRLDVTSTGHLRGCARHGARYDEERWGPCPDCTPYRVAAFKLGQMVEQLVRGDVFNTGPNGVLDGTPDEVEYPGFTQAND